MIHTEQIIWKEREREKKTSTSNYCLDHFNPCICVIRYHYAQTHSATVHLFIYSCCLNPLIASNSRWHYSQETWWWCQQFAQSLECVRVLSPRHRTQSHGTLSHLIDWLVTFHCTEKNTVFVNGAFFLALSSIPIVSSFCYIITETLNNQRCHDNRVSRARKYFSFPLRRWISSSSSSFT